MCTCDTCCAQCGHEPWCGVYGSAEALPDLEAAIADPRPGSLLAWLTAPARAAEAAS